MHLSRSNPSKSVACCSAANSSLEGDFWAEWWRRRLLEALFPPRRRSPARLILEIDKGQLLAGAVLHDEARF